MSVPLVIACVALAVVGAVVQTSIGLGFGMLTSPILALIDHDFVPGGILVAVFPMTLYVAVTCARHVDRRGVVLATAGRVPGAVAGALVAAAVSGQSLALALGVVVLVAVALSVRFPHVEPTPRLTPLAGAMSGFMGTATGVGGPPMALLYQGRDAQTVRATLAAFFTIGAVLSLGALAATGDLTAHQVRLGLLLWPGVAAGIAIAPRVQHHVHGPRFRPVLLAISAASASILLLKQLA